MNHPFRGPFRHRLAEGGRKGGLLLHCGGDSDPEVGDFVIYFPKNLHRWEKERIFAT